jgi:hypothetical protein
MKVLETSPQPVSIDLTKVFRTLLPQQLGLSPLLANLTAIFQAPAAIPFSASLLDALKALMKALPNARQVSTPQGLRQALLNSGLFLEAKLAKELAGQPSTLSGDIKTALLALRQVLLKDGVTTGPGELATDIKQQHLDVSPLPIRGAALHPQPRVPTCVSPQLSLDKVIRVLTDQVDGVLARLQLVQIASISPRKDHPLAWLFELPICRDGKIDVLALNIEESREKESREKNRRSPSVEHIKHWVATLAVDMEVLGPLQAKIIVYEQQVTVDLWAERPLAVELYNSTFDLLTESLKQVEMTPVRLACHQGKMPVGTPSKTHSTLLNIRA